MTNRVEALFLCRALVLMSERRHEVPRSVLNTTANAVCYTHWHYSVVGVTVTLALLEHGSVLLKRRHAPCSTQTTTTKGSTAHGERGGPLRRAHGVHQACCIVVARRRVRVSCP